MVDGDVCDNGDDGDFFILDCTALRYPNAVPAPIHHSSHPAPLPLQVYHPNCRNDLIRPHYLHIITHTYTHTYIVHTCINSKLGQSIFEVLLLKI